jgi:HlyD family secretion protein
LKLLQLSTLTNWRITFYALSSFALAACGAKSASSIVGTLERHRIEVAANTSEQILSIAVREGDRVQPGQLLAELDSGTQLAGRNALASDLLRAQERLRELQNGARPEELTAAQARLQAAQAAQLQAGKEFERLRELAGNGLVATSQLDVQQRLRDSASADARAAQAQLQLLQRGTRREQLDQARAAVKSAAAQLSLQEIQRSRLRLLAPIAGSVESIPYRQGERPPPNAPVVVLLESGTPYARVYIPEPLRAKVQPGMKVRVRIDGVNEILQGTVRFVAGEASFTPYYALTQRDRSRLSFAAEIDVTDAAAQTLPVGMPLEVLLDSAP